MKKLIIIISIILLSTNVYANQLPGYLEVGMSFSNFQSDLLENNKDVYITNLNVEYGSKFKYFNPYVFTSEKTYVWNYGGNILTDYEYAPFFGEYTIGAGIRFFEILYVKFEHQCQHYISSLQTEQIEYFKNYPTEKYNKITVGLKVTID